LTSFRFVNNTIIAFLADKYKSKFGHIGHSECELHHTIFAIYLIVYLE